MKTYTFTVVIEKEPEDPGYYAYVPELPGCVSDGATVDEARTNIAEAIQLYIESLIEDGEPVPGHGPGTQVEQVTVAVSA